MSQHIKLDFEFIPTADPGYRVAMVFTNLLDVDIPASESLFFSFVRPLTYVNISGATLVSRQGDFYHLILNAPLAPGNELRITLSGEDVLAKYSDLPYGMYFQLADQTRLVVNTAQQQYIGYDELVDKMGLSREGPEAGVIPILNTESSDYWIVPTVLKIDLPKSFAGKATLDVLESLLEDFQITNKSSHVQFDIDQEDSTETYRLRVDAQGACIGGSIRGCRHGLMSLVQMISQAKEQKLAFVDVMDTPAYSYRGIHLDVVRHFFDKHSIKKVLRLAAVYKLNYFHWHLTDDDGWRVESDAFPELHKKGAWRGPDEILPPQMGSGSQKYGGYYSKQDIREVVSYASDLGIQVVPEMDLPGHARVLTQLLPNYFSDESDTSEYLSVQNHNDNVIDIVKQSGWDVLKVLIDEWLELFPGNLFHIGSDEVPDGAWTGSPAAKKFMSATGLENTVQLHGWFLKRIETYLVRKGKTCAGWEEVTADKQVSNATWVYSWQGVEAGNIALKNGHPVVMTPAQYCYFDLAYSDHCADPGYYWAGLIDTAKCLSLTKTLSNCENRQKLMGVQACLWTELVEDEARLDFMMLPRILAFAQVAWSEECIDQIEFLTIARSHVDMLTKLGFENMRPASIW